MKNDGSGILLTGKGKHVAVIFQRGLQSGLEPVAPGRGGRTLLGILRQGEGDFERLTERHRAVVRRILEAGEGVALGAGERHEPAFQGVHSGAGSEGEGSGGNQRQENRGQRPPAVSLRWQRVVQLAFSRLDRDGLHRCFPQPGREGVRVSGLILEFDDAEQAVAEARVAFRDEPGELGFTPLTPDPAVQPVRGESREQRYTRNQDAQPHPAGRLPDPVEPEDEKEGNQQADHAGSDGFHDFHPPEMTPERVQLKPERLRDGDFGIGRTGWREHGKNDRHPGPESNDGQSQMSDRTSSVFSPTLAVPTRGFVSVWKRSAGSRFQTQAARPLSR